MVVYFFSGKRGAKDDGQRRMVKHSLWLTPQSIIYELRGPDYFSLPQLRVLFDDIQNGEK